MHNRLIRCIPLTVVMVMLSVASATFGSGTATASPTQPHNDSGSNLGPSAYSTCSNGPGYFITGSNGATVGFGVNRTTGPAIVPPNLHLDSSVVAVAETSPGYVLATSGGGVYGYNPSTSLVTTYPSLVGTHLNAPIVGLAMAMNSNGSSYYLVAKDGGVFAFGGAQFDGSMGGQHLNAPIVGMSFGPSGFNADGSPRYTYYLVAQDGGIFAFGGAPFDGSMGGQHLNAPIVGMAPAPALEGGLPFGYWLVAADGGIFSFGGASFRGSMGGQQLNAPVVGMAFGTDVITGVDANYDQGYWLVAADGGVFSFGDTPYCGSAVGQIAPAPVVGIASTFTLPYADPGQGA